MVGSQIAFDRSEPHVVFVALDGEHDIYTRRKLKDQLIATLRDGSPW